MPKVVQMLLGIVWSILLTPGMLAIMAFPVVLAIQFPTRATADFLGLIIAGSGALLAARGLYSWLRTRPRTVYTPPSVLPPCSR